MRGPHVLLALLMVLLLPGCTGRFGQFTFLTTGPFTLPIEAMEQRGHVKGEACETRVLGLSAWPALVAQGASPQAALDQALAEADADALVDAVVSWYWFDLLLYGRSCVYVEGKAVHIE